MRESKKSGANLMVFLGVLALTGSVAGLPGEDIPRDPAPQEKTEEQVKRLSKDLEAHRAVLKLQDARIEELEAHQERVDRWFAALPKTTARLTTALTQTRNEGFTRAGANVGAKETLLNALADLATSLATMPEAAPAKR